MVSPASTDHGSPPASKPGGPFARRKARKAEERRQRKASEKTAVPQESSPWVVVGRILKAVGLEGIVRISCMSDHAERFSPGSVLHRCRDSESPVEVRILESRGSTDGRFADLLLEGVTDVDTARMLVGDTLVIPREERLPAPSDAYYPDELVGMDILSPDGQVDGRVSFLEADVPSPFLVIQSPRLGEILVPFRKVCIEKIDRQNRTISLVEPLDYHYSGE
ncbi:MAG: ribosome maturation factor RimM [Candidatus Ozemobacteraceae bacterium]